MKPALRLCLAAAIASLLPASGWAAQQDEFRPIYADRVEHAQRQFGDVRFVMGAGHAMEWLEMYAGGNLLATLREFDAQEVLASPDGKYFLAISNTSYSSLAFAVLDRKGHVLFQKSHEMGDLRYCSRSASYSRYWIDAATANARFEVDHGSPASGAKEYLKSVVVRGCDGEDLLLAQAVEPTAHVGKPAPQIAGAAGREPDGGSFFIGNTIANLRGMDPTFGGRTLVLVDGRRAALPQTDAVPSCEFTLRETAAPVLVDSNGGRTSLPAHPGVLSACSRTGTGAEVLLVYRVARDGRSYNLARVFDARGALLASTELDHAGSLEFKVAGQQYAAEVPAP